MHSVPGPTQRSPSFTPDGQRTTYPAPRAVASLEPTTHPDVAFVRYEFPELGSPAGVFDARSGGFSPIAERAGVPSNAGPTPGAPLGRWLVVDEPERKGEAVLDLAALTLRRSTPCRRFTVSDDERFLFETMGGGQTCGPATWTSTIAFERAVGSEPPRIVDFPVEADRPFVRSMSPSGRWMVAGSAELGASRELLLWAVDLNSLSVPERIGALADVLGWIDDDVAALERDGVVSLLDLRNRTETPLPLPSPAGSPSISRVQLCNAPYDPAVLLHSYEEGASRTVRLVDLAGTVLAGGEGRRCRHRMRCEATQPAAAAVRVVDRTGCPDAGVCRRHPRPANRHVPCPRWAQPAICPARAGSRPGGVPRCVGPQR